MGMAKTISFLFIAGLLLSTVTSLSVATHVNGNGVSDEELMFLEVPLAITASKSSKTVNEAPSVMTVWTAEDIQKMGIRTLEELLERTIGFFPTYQLAGPRLGTRGIITGLEPNLLLIDGHSMNSIALQGMQNAIIFPTLSKVKRVEILRGPGSTLWGSDAALSVINVITKDGDDINGFKITSDFESEHDAFYTNALYGRSFAKDQSIMFSFTQMQSYGKYLRTSTLGNAAGATTFYNGQLGWQDSWELFAKATLKEITLTVLAEDLTNTQAWGSFSRDNARFNRRKHTFADFNYDHVIGDNITWATRMFSDLILSYSYYKSIIVSPAETGTNQGYEQFALKEQNVGLDSMITWKCSSHEFISGVRAVKTEIEPQFSIGYYQDPSTLPPTVTVANGTVDVAFLPRDYDYAMGLFLQDDWNVFKDMQLIYGIRADSNNLRENSIKYMPRFGAIYDMTPCITVKYLYNTGYLRPTANMSNLGKPRYQNGTYYIGADKSENINSHDVQLRYHDNSKEASLTLYQTQIDNLFASMTGATAFMYEGRRYRFDTTNTNTVTSKGAEFDWRLNMNRLVYLYGGLSYILESKVDQFEIERMGFSGTIKGGYLFNDDKDMLAYPKYFATFGANINYALMVFDIHYRGWTEMWTKTVSGYEKLGPEHFVDLSILYKDVFAVKLFDLTLYSKNVFNNNNAKTAMAVLGGYYTDIEGRTIGLKASYKF